MRTEERGQHSLIAHIASQASQIVYIVMSSSNSQHSFMSSWNCAHNSMGSSNIPHSSMSSSNHPHSSMSSSNRPHSSMSSSNCPHSSHYVLLLISIKMSLVSCQLEFRWDITIKQQGLVFSSSNRSYKTIMVNLSLLLSRLNDWFPKLQRTNDVGTNIL